MSTKKPSKSSKSGKGGASKPVLARKGPRDPPAASPKRSPHVSRAPGPDALASPTEPEAPPTATPPGVPTPLGPPEAAQEAAPAPLPPAASPTEIAPAEGAGKTPTHDLEAAEETSDGVEEETSTADLPPKRAKGVAPELMLRVESLLFGAARPLSVHDLLQSLGGDVDHVAVQRALRKLSRTYQNRNTSLEVRKAGDAWAIQVRREYLEVAHKMTPTEIPVRTLRVLALIAYHQPIRQSLLVRMVGEVGYEEVKALKELGFVHAVARASTLELSTTSRFAEYFGLESTDHGKIREFLEKRLGMTFPPPPADPSDPGDAPPSAEGSDPAPEIPQGPLPAE